MNRSPFKVISLGSTTTIFTKLSFPSNQSNKKTLFIFNIFMLISTVNEGVFKTMKGIISIANSFNSISPKRLFSSSSVGLLKPISMSKEHSFSSILTASEPYSGCKKVTGFPIMYSSNLSFSLERIYCDFRMSFFSFFLFKYIQYVHCY